MVPLCSGVSAGFSSGFLCVNEAKYMRNTSEAPQQQGKQVMMSMSLTSSRFFCFCVISYITTSISTHHSNLVRVSKS
jgi:hypothetical protein